MNYKDIKNKLLKLLHKNKDELIKELKKYSYDKKKYTESSEEYFKYAWKARACDGKSYYVSNHGHVILTDKVADIEKISKRYLDENKQRFWEIKTNNGYLTKETKKDSPKLPKHWMVALHTDIYLFVKEAFKDEFADEMKNLEKEFPNERLELHHINNNPNDNNLNNLIYLPKSIHVCAHKYIN